MTTTTRSRLGRGDPGTRSGPGAAWLWLTAPIAALLVIAAGGELLVEGVFGGDAANFVAQAVGQDYVTLTVALPALVAGALLAGRGSDRARLVWLGVLTYLVYTYLIYAFHVRFNPLFLVYVALLGLSLYALIGGLATTDFAAVRARFAGRTPVRTASVLLAALAVLFYLAWLGEVVPALLEGSMPQSVADAGTPTGAAHVLDMAWILPAMLLTAVWLWRRRPAGYVLAGVLLAFASLMTLAITAMMVAMNLYGEPVGFGMAALFGVLSAACVGMSVKYLKCLKDGGRRGGRP
jgi:hypothetical protein